MHLPLDEQEYKQMGINRGSKQSMQNILNSLFFKKWIDVWKREPTILLCHDTQEQMKTNLCIYAEINGCVEETYWKYLVWSHKQQILTKRQNPTGSFCSTQIATTSGSTSFHYLL